MPSLTKFFSGSQAIPDNNLTGTSNALAFTIPTGAILTGITVTVDITHSFDYDLDIFLIAPNAAGIELSTDNGGSNDNYHMTTFSDGALNSILVGSAPFDGFFRPEQALSLLMPGNAGGNWTLKVADDAALDTGTLDFWSLTLTFTLGNGTGASEVLVGSAEIDRMHGLGGNDIINALAGDDICNGGDGQDILRGGLGRDFLRGDANTVEHDVFDYNKIAESTWNPAGRDVILDFQPNVDDIDLSTIDANTLVAGNQAFKFIGGANFHHKAGEVRVSAQGSNTLVSADVNGDGKPYMAILLNGTLTLDKFDFIL